jgi:hypothetical protein
MREFRLKDLPEGSQLKRYAISTGDFVDVMAARKAKAFKA